MLARLELSLSPYATIKPIDSALSRPLMTNGTPPPQIGMLATVRNRRGLITSVEPYDGDEEGRLNLVRVEYTDTDGTPEDQVIWEREVGTSLLEPTALPEVISKEPMHPRDFDALVRASRWSALTPLLPIDDSGPIATHMPITAPFFGAIQVEDFQLVPLLKALQMPRVTMLLADDVGLGKTIEAGLVIAELLSRRRIRRILILCPASLRRQWQQEMKDKFSLDFEIIDRAETHAIKKRLGLDANPWRSAPRIISSYHYLRQPDIREQFRSACKRVPNSPHLPWDLLIVDEAHNLMPANFGADSDLCETLRQISPEFEHRLFLTATPHNGYTRCFSGLLQQLDPVRFTQKSDLTDQEKQRVDEIVIRRLKREINAASDRPRFCERELRPIPLKLSAEEKALSAAFQAFRGKVHNTIRQRSKQESLAGAFAIEILNKRLLSGPFTFADSWYRYLTGMAQDEEAAFAEVQAARRAAEEEIDDDLEAEGRAAHAARTIGAWLKPLADQLKDEIAGVTEALERLGLTGAQADKQPAPAHDARWDELARWINANLRAPDGRWLDDERLIIFTEYKTTLDYLSERLTKLDPTPGVIRTLYGGMSDDGRADIKDAFNNPADPIRILVATDAASEGLNLQETARFLLHWEIPWNPARLDQRNGRLDRHGQARDVIILHFTSDDDADLRFMAHVISKVNSIREDLGSMGEVFDAAFERRFLSQVDSDQVRLELDNAVTNTLGRVQLPTQQDPGVGAELEARLDNLMREIDLTSETLRDTLELALGLGVGLPRFTEPDANGRVSLAQPLPPRWSELIDDTLRLRRRGAAGALPNLVFDPTHFIEEKNGRLIFRPSKDTVLLHLGHPLYQHALARLARARFPGDSEGFDVSRWIVRYGPVPKEADALLIFTVEELAMNDLREPVHHWVRSIRFSVHGDALGGRLAHIPPADDQISARPVEADDIARARAIWDDISPELGAFIDNYRAQIEAELSQALKHQKEIALEEEKSRFANRIQEVNKEISATTVAKLERDRDRLINDLRQQSLFAEVVKAKEQRLQDIEQELATRTSRLEELRDILTAERDRVLNLVIPSRYQLAGVHVFPITVEIRLPEAAR